MEIFSLLLKKSLENKKNFVDVTRVIPTAISYNMSSRVYIDTEVELHILRSKDSEVHFKVYSMKQIVSEDIRIHVDTDLDVTRIKISSEKSVKKCYIELFLPSVIEIKVTSENTDIRIEKCDIKEIFVQTNNGEVMVVADKFSVMNLNTIGGDMNVLVTKEPLNYKLHSKCGDTIIEKVKNHANANRKLKCYSNSGDLLLKYADD